MLQKWGNSKACGLVTLIIAMLWCTSEFSELTWKGIYSYKYWEFRLKVERQLKGIFPPLFSPVVRRFAMVVLTSKMYATDGWNKTFRGHVAENGKCQTKCCHLNCTFAVFGLQFVYLPSLINFTFTPQKVSTTGLVSKRSKNCRFCHRSEIRKKK